MTERTAGTDDLLLEVGADPLVYLDDTARIGMVPDGQVDADLQPFPGGRPEGVVDVIAPALALGRGHRVLPPPQVVEVRVADEGGMTLIPWPASRNPRVTMLKTTSA